MIQRDYILRQIQQLIQVLARVMELRVEGSLEEAHSHIEEALSSIWDLHRDDLVRLSPDEIRELCIVEGQFHTQFAVALADLLNEDGAIFEDQGKFFHAKESYVQARAFNEMVLALGNEIPFDIYDRITDLDAAIKRNEVEDVI